MIVSYSETEQLYSVTFFNQFSQIESVFKFVSIAHQTQTVRNVTGRLYHRSHLT